MSRPAWVASIAGSALLLTAIALGWMGHSEPARCPTGMREAGARCCGVGQHLSAFGCAGEPSTCASIQRAEQDRCSLPPSQVSIGPLDMWVDVNDWDLAGKVPQRKRLEVAAFAMDRGEVTHAQWAACARAGVCTVLEGEEPERPVVNVTPEQASAYCAYVGGRLPSSEQWLAAAMGAEQRRYPWGPFGLVCRRAVFGLVDGPCARGGHSADVPGSRPDGATPDGIVDLAGNVAEWTREASGSWVARGGSFRSTLASELKSLAVEHVSTPRDDVGLRCVYGR